MRVVAGASRRIRWVEVAAGVLVSVAVLVRVAALFLPQLAETNYEEAEAGLMARDVLRGDYIALWRGVPYLGTLHVYLAALLFALFGATTPVLRLAPLLLSLVAAFFSYRLARALFGPRWALLTLAWWALPPAFLTRLSVTPYNYVGSVAWGTAILYLTHRAVSRRPATPATFGLLGLFSGLALWDHLIGLCVLAASGLWLLGAAGRPDGRPTARASACWLAGLLLGSAPLWLWNVAHRFETVTALLWPGVGPTQPLLARLAPVATNLVELLGRARYFWADPPGGPPLGALVALVYLPALAYVAVGLAVAATRRLAGQPRRPWEPPAGTGLVFTAFVLACAQYAWSRHDGERYLMPVYASVPLLLTGFARGLSRAARWLPGLVVGALLSVHAIDNVRLSQAGAGSPPRPIDPVISFLLRHDLRHVYAHHRVAWPLGFESAERITASDLHGYLTNRYHLRAGGQSDIAPFLRAMEAVDLAPRVAFVTHDALGLPTAADLEMALRLLGGASRQTRLGPYTVFWDFQPPAERIREIPPALISLRASHGSDGTPFAIDRHIATTWKSGIHHQVPGMVVEATLDRPRRVAKIVLDPGNFVRDYPRGLRVESSLDGRTWQELVAVPRHLGGIDWLGGHPKLNLKGRIGVSVGPVEARHVRLTQIGYTGERVRWTIAELLLYEADPRPAAAGADGVPTPAERPAVLGLLQGAAVEALYSSDEGHVYFGRHLPASIRTVRLRDRRDDPVQRSERVVRPERRNAFFLPSESPLLEADFRAHGLEVVTHRFASGILYLATARRPSDPLYWAHGRLLRLAFPSAADRR